MNKLVKTTAAIAMAAAIIVPTNLASPVATAASACPTACFVDAISGDDANGGASAGDALQTIQAGIDGVDPNGTVFVAAGTYTEAIDVNKPLILDGAGSSVVTIDASSFDDYSVQATANDVTLEGFTVTGNSTATAAYGLKISSSSPTRLSNITVDDVVVNNSRRTGIDLNGVDGGLITNVEVNDVPYGNGLSATDSNDIVFENITTNNNAWGGLAIYTFGQYYTLGSDNITIQGINSFGEAVPVYVQEGNFNNSAAPEPVTNLTVNGFAYTVMNSSLPGYTYHQINQADAIAFATGLEAVVPAANSYVNEIATGDFWVGTLGGVDMTVQAAIDHASAGDSIRVLPGTFEANVTVDKPVKIIGAGSGAGEADNTILQKGTNIAVVTLEASGSGVSAADPLLFQDLRVEPVGVYGFNVPGAAETVQFVEFDNVHVIGTNTGAGFESEVGLKVATTASLTDVVIVDSAFDELVYGWYFAKQVDEGTGTSNVTDVQVSATSFSNNEAKGIYVEKLSDTTFDDVTVVNNGLDTSFFNAKWNAGFDINLKGEEVYENITITNSTFAGNGLGVEEGTGLTIKGRDDGTTYGAHPAALSGVTITGNTITGNERGLRFGEPGKNNETPTGTTVTGNNISGNLVAGVINETQSPTPALENWWGDASGPSGEGPGSGDSVSPNVTFCPWLDGAVGVGNLVLNDCPGSNSLDVTKTVDWNGVDPDAGQTFEICIQGPTHPTTNCQLADFDGGTLTWNALYRGDYVVTETDPGVDWTVDIAGSPITVEDAVATTPASVTNTHTLVDELPVFPTPPDDVTTETTPGGIDSVVSFDLPVATDDVSTPTVACLPASGSTFPVGSTTVTCTATDSANQTAETTFSVTVTQVQVAPVDAPPTFDAAPGDASATTEPGGSTAIVDYDTPQATDDDTTTPATVLCLPASGSEFEVGETVVTCTATDSNGQTAEVSFTVTVNPYSDLIAVAPARILDTRDNGTNVTVDGDSQGNGPITAGGTTTVVVAGRGGIPADAIGTMVNIAAINPASDGFATLYPCSDEVPITASLNYEANTSISNATFVDLSATGTVCVYSSGSTGLALDVVGYLPATSRLGLVDPARILETRIGTTFTTIDGRSQGDGTIAAGNTIEVKVAGRAGVPANAVAAMVNVAAVNPTDAGFITLYPCGSDRPIAASLNYTLDTNISNATLVELSPDGVLCVFTEDATDLTIDIMGFAPPGTDVGTINPGRFLDTRVGDDKVTIDGASQGDGTVAAGAFVEVTIAGRGDVPAGAISAVVNLAAINPTDVGFATLYPCSETPPLAASLNYTPAVNISNAILVDLSSDGSVCVFTSAEAHFTLDVLSYVLAGSTSTTS